MIASYEELKSSPGGLPLPLFTESPRRGVLGNWASGFGVLGN